MRAPTSEPCSECGAPIVLLPTRWGHKLKVNPEPVTTGGHVRVYRDGSGDIVGPLLAIRLHEDGERVFNQHRCPAAYPAAGPEVQR